MRSADRVSAGASSPQKVGVRASWQRRCDSCSNVSCPCPPGDPPMKLRHLHDWDLTPTEAREVQDAMVARLDLTPALSLAPGDIVLGVDNSYLETAAATTAFAAAVAMTWPDLE